MKQSEFDGRGSREKKNAVPSAVKEALGLTESTAPQVKLDVQADVLPGSGVSLRVTLGDEYIGTVTCVLGPRADALACLGVCLNNLIVEMAKGQGQQATNG